MIRRACSPLTRTDYERELSAAPADKLPATLRPHAADYDRVRRRGSKAFGFWLRTTRAPIFDAIYEAACRSRGIEGNREASQ